MCKNASFRSTWIGTTCNGGFFINKALGLRRKANFVGAGHFRNYLLSRKSQLELRSQQRRRRRAVEVAEVVVAATTLLKVVSHPPQLSPPTIRSINARRRSLCLSCWGVYALRVTAVIRTRISFAVSGEAATPLGDVTSETDAMRPRWLRIVKRSRANSSGNRGLVWGCLCSLIASKSSYDLRSSQLTYQTVSTHHSTFNVRVQSVTTKS
ncbi:hypothetical protein DBV15_01830 [Temnothorax longispinosus]|uniref:Uncharacterized protein n=1 Tax=Temnothorax longispinosus TaxID=300112 RepID=A0A4S2KV93_9HYME|nr:hypothetical protein DBV15_01830 [Temnothorax longispinosus]